MRISLKWVLLFGVVGLLVISVSIILASSYLTSQKVLLGHARDIMENIATFTIKESQHYLNPAQDAAQLTEKLALSDIVSKRQIDKLERYFFEQLRLHSSFAGIYIGFNNGEFFYVSRMNERSPNGFRTKIISDSTNQKRTKLIWHDADMTPIGEELDPNDTYDPRKRPWYKDAVRTHKTVWTQPYIFYTSQKPGLTVASPVYGSDNLLMGVVGVDIEIDEISNFLAHLNVGKNGRAFILTTDGNLVAFPDLSRLRWPTSGDGEGFRLARINEIDDIPALKAYLSVKDQGVDLSRDLRVFGSFIHDDQTYHTMFAPFANPQWPWLIGIYLPEDDYLGHLKANRNFNIAIMLTIAALGSLVGFSIVRGIVSSMLTLRREARAVSKYEFVATYKKESPFKEIQATIDAFNAMKKGLAEYQHQNQVLADGLKDRAKELANKEMHLRSMLATLANFTDALIILDQSNRIRFLNSKAETMLKMELHAVRNQPFTFPCKPLGEESVECEIDGENGSKVVEMKVLATEWEGDVAKLLALRDITDRKRMEQEIKWRADTLQMLHDTALDLPSRESLNELYNAIAERVSEFLGALGVWIFSWDDGEESLTGVLSHQLTPNVTGRQAMMTHGIFDQVMVEGRSMLEEKCVAGRFPGLIFKGESINFCRCLLGPLVWGDRTLGVILVGWDSGRRFSESDLLLLDRFSPLAAAALYQKQLLTEMEGFYRQAEKDAQTKSVLLKEINHRVKNNMASIIGILYAEKSHSPARNHSEFQEAVNGVIHQIQGLSTVHELLNASHWQSMNLYDLVDKMAHNALKALPRNKQITVKITPSNIRIAPAIAPGLAMIVNECATNTGKYALDGRDQGQLDIVIEMFDKGRKIQLIFNDDGPGYPSKVLRFERVNTGLYLLKNIVERELNGQLILENNAGAVTRILVQTGHIKEAVNSKAEKKGSVTDI